MPVEQLKMQSPRTYATKKTLIKMVELYYQNREEKLSYVICTDETTGRFYPIFIGNSAFEAGVHFNFCCAN